MSSTADTAERFAFGKNWLSFLNDLSDDRIAEAEKGVRALAGLDRLDGKTFIDIGSGSGLFSLAARRLGAKVLSFDYDIDSVSATQALKDRYFPADADWRIVRASVLDAKHLATLGSFDIVFSWGVLHHTGAMYEAVTIASKLTAPDGIFIFALYRKTKFCGFWAAEKRWYSSASPLAQRITRAAYVGLFRLAFLFKRRDFAAHVANYKIKRGMEFYHDVHDWLGGYPYESISPQEAAAFMSGLGFSEVRSVIAPTTLGIMGSGCDEFVYRRST